MILCTLEIRVLFNYHLIMKIWAKFIDDQYEKREITHTRTTVRAVLLNEHNEIALIKVKGNDIFGIRDYYELPGGGKKRKETLLEALRREIIEEVGCSIKDIEEIGRVIDFYNLINRKNDNHYYLAKIDRNITPPSLEDYEKEIFQEIIFVPIHKAIEMYKTKLNTPLGKLVGQRELVILNKVSTQQLK